MTRKLSGSVRGRLSRVVLDGEIPSTVLPALEADRAQAIADLVAENEFVPLTAKPDRSARGPFVLHLALQDGRLVFDIRRGNGSRLAVVGLALGPFRRLVKDYHLLVDSHVKAVEEGHAERIQAIDMGRRGLHNEGATLMRERLDGKIAIDFPTARRLFTLVCVLHQRVLRAMDIDGVPYRSIWVDPDDGWSVRIIDQTKLPWSLEIVRLTDVTQAAHAIRSMQVRGAPLIGAAAAHGLCLGLRTDPSSAAMERDAALLAATRPTAVNLRWALERMLTRLRNTPAAERPVVAYAEAAAIADEDVAQNAAIGRHGLTLIEHAAAAKAGRRVNILTHCNAGWLATVDWGTALAPIYMAFNAGIDLHVWVDETRPRNQGAALTAWELGKHAVAHTVVADNAGGHLMQHGEVDLVIVGTDRVTRRGDVANKIGTYLKALAAHDNALPFWVALPSTTIDWTVSDGVSEIPIERRGAAEVTDVTGRTADGTIATVRVVPMDSAAANPAFDVTPARLVTGLITDRGRCDASAEGLLSLFPERR